MMMAKRRAAPPTALAAASLRRPIGRSNPDRFRGSESGASRAAVIAPQCLAGRCNPGYAEIKGAITRGERKDGTNLKPPMAYQLYATIDRRRPQRSHRLSAHGPAKE